MIDLLGIIASVAFALCALPQAIKCYKEKHSYGISWLFIILWAVGEICMLFYVICKLQDWILIINYAGNLFFIFIIIYYKMFPKAEEVKYLNK